MTNAAPPFAALRALEAVCRHRNFTYAGAELGMTHSAVSQHMRKLERTFGTALFVRRGLEMQPSPAAMKLAEAYRLASRLVETAVADVSAGPTASQLTVSMMPSMASLWLMPRMAELKGDLPDVTLNVRTSRELADIEAGEADLAIRFGDGDWPRLTARRLFEEEVFPVCSPAFAEEHSLAEPADLARAPLIWPDTPDWSVWFDAVGVAAPQPAHILRVDHAELALEAAAAGLGAALVRQDLAAGHLASGRLVRPFRQTAKTGLGCYLVWRAASPREGAIRRLGDWIEKALADEGARRAPAGGRPLGVRLSGEPRQFDAAADVEQDGFDPGLGSNGSAIGPRVVMSRGGPEHVVGRHQGARRKPWEE
jgi:LysR family transcriptional regulator, glycine cleavage system transcriptional activator